MKLILFVVMGEIFWNLRYDVELTLMPTYPLRIYLTFTLIFTGILLVGRLQPQAPPVLGEDFMVNLSTDAELVQCHKLLLYLIGPLSFFPLHPVHLILVYSSSVLAIQPRSPCVHLSDGITLYPIILYEG